MDTNQIVLTTNLVVSLLIFALVAKIYILPNLGKWQPKALLLPILLLQSTRHLGLMFLASGAVLQGIPAEFAIPAAFGDLASSFLALAIIPLVLSGSRKARPLLWVLTIFGTLDFLAAIVLATIFGAAPFMSAAWWIPAMWVPGLLVAHFVTYKFLTLKPSRAI